MWMKRLALTLFLVSISFAGNEQAHAQNRRAAEIAERQQIQEKLDQLSASYQNLIDAQYVLREQIKVLRERLDEGSAEEPTAPVDTSAFATKAEVLAIEERMAALEKKWEEDTKKIAKQIGDLKGVIQKAMTQANAAAAVPAGDYYEHTLAKGETIAAVVRAFQDAGVATSVEAVKAANPDLDPTSLKIGVVLRIPAPSSGE